MDEKAIRKVLAYHKMWQIGLPEGVRADLSGASLSRADLSGADLSGANLSEADLRWANLRWANLSDCNFHNAVISYRGDRVIIKFVSHSDGKK